MNQRVAAHLHRKAAAAGEAESHSETRPAVGGRAAQAAARVAARYANAPSYSEMLADEARVVVRAAQAASRAAQEAQAAAQYVLDGLEGVSLVEPAQEPAWELEAPPQPITRRRPAPVEARHKHSEARLFEEAPLFSSHREPLAEPADAELRAMPSRESSPSTREVHPGSEVDPGDRHGQELTGNAGHSSASVQFGESVQPIYANLIEFPRPMVAARKVRPRLAEGPLAVAESAPQLSIFEVDPGTVSCEPAPLAVEETAAPAWMLPQWPAMEPATQAYEEVLDEPAVQPPAAAIEPVSMSRRLLAIVVDCALITASFLAVALPAECNATKLPAPRAAELGSALAILVIGVAYLVFFFALARSTPGMRYAGIQLSTFAGLRPSRAQRCSRLLLLPLSVLPLGLGLAWAFFDEGRLAWHDRLSQTYLRKR